LSRMGNLSSWQKKLEQKERRQISPAQFQDLENN
jgi:hypothetical protein